MPLDTEKVESLRKALGLSQEEAARRSGLASRQVWNDIVSGRKANITLDTLEAMANTLHVNSTALIKIESGP